MTKTASALTLLGSISLIFTSSCAMSEKKSGDYGSVAGGLAGGFGGYLLGKQHGRTKGDAIKGGVVGAVAGAGLGEEAGKKSSTLKGLENVLPFTAR